MSIEILMPALSPTMKEGNLAKWVKKEGDKVEPGDVIAEIETDKATMEVEAVDEGILGKILVQEGSQDVKVNAIIAYLLEDGETIADIKVDNQASANTTNNNSEEQKKEEVISGYTSNKTEVVNDYSNKVFASPLAKRIASQKNIPIESIEGSGPNGRVVKKDVESYQVPQNTTQHNINNEFRNSEEYKVIPNNNMRKVIARRLLDSKQNVPHFYLSIDCNLDKLLDARKEINNATDKNNPAYKISVNDFIIKAVANSLKEVPEANSSWTDEAVLQYNNVDVSVAVAIDGGLITPVIRNADKKSLATISNEMKDLAKRARNNALAPEEFQGGSFSISNLGMFGIKKFEAIINPPQGAILACGAASKRTVVINDQIQIANVCDFSLSCDHRVIDGAVGAMFLKSFKKFIENPVMLIV